MARERELVTQPQTKKMKSLNQGSALLWGTGIKLDFAAYALVG